MAACMRNGQTLDSTMVAEVYTVRKDREIVHGHKLRSLFLCPAVGESIEKKHFLRDKPGATNTCVMT